MDTRPATNSCRSRRRRWTTGLATGLALLSATAGAGAVTPPAVPPELEVPAGYKAFRSEHAVGTQNYVCLPSASEPGFAWAFFGPQATLFNRHDRQTMTHFLGANPEEAGTLRPSWQDSRDSSSVWAAPIASSTDPAFVDPDSVPWLLLATAGRREGPTGGRRLGPTSFIQRVNTSGGKAPATGCTQAQDVGKKALVPYETDYVFYKSRRPIE